MTIDIKLVAYEPFGARLGELPQPLAIESADPLSDTPSLAMQYSKHAAGHSLLQQPIEIAREVYNPTTGEWFEPANGRFLLIKNEGDQLDATGNMNYIAPGYSWLLNKLVVYPFTQALVDGWIQDAENSEESTRQALNQAENEIAQSLGYSTDRPVAYQDRSPTDTNNIWVDTTDTSSLKYMVYSESTNKWELRATHTAATVNAYNAWIAHQQSQGQLQDVQGQAKLTKRTFQGQHAGAVMATLIDEAFARGQRMPGLVRDFDTETDSAGQPWGTTGGTIEVNTGTSLLRLLQSFVEQGQLDFRTDGRVLQLYKQDTAMLRERGDEVVLRYNLDIDEAPDRNTLEHLASEMLFLGEEGLHFTRSNPEAPTPWGVWEASMSQSGVDNEAMGNLLATRALENASAPRVERTRALLFRQGQASSLPYIHYQPGDYVMAPNSEGELERQRIQQVTLTKDGTTGQVAGNLVLNDRFLEREIRNERNTQALIGGTAGTGGAPGGTTPESYVDLRTPAPPRYVVVGADTSPRKGGGYESYFGVQWWWGRNATDGTLMQDNLLHFEVQYRLVHFGQSSWPDQNTYVWRSLPPVDQNTWSTAHGPVDAINPHTGEPAAYEVRVRAVARNNKPSDWSVSGMVTVPLDAEPPATPSRPTASANGASIGVSWDGLNDAGGAPPFDFAYVAVEEAVIPDTAPDPLTDTYLNSLTWTRLGDRISHAGTATLFGRTYDQPYAYRLVAVDQNENESAPGAPSNAAIPVSAVDTAAIQDQIDASNQANLDAMADLDTRLDQAEGDIKTGPVELGRLTNGDLVLGSAVAETIWSRKLVSSKVQAREVAIGAGENLFVNGQGDQGDATNFSQFLTPTDTSWVPASGGSIAWGVQDSTPRETDIAFPVIGGEGYRVAGSVLSSAPSTDKVEIVFYDPLGGELESFIMLDGATTTNWVWAYGTVFASVGAVSAKLRFTGNLNNEGAYVWWGGFDVVQQVDSSLVVKGGITSDSIAALAIQTGHLAANSITGDKLEVDSAQAKLFTGDAFVGRQFTGGWFQGSTFITGPTTGAYVAMDGNGLYSYNQSGDLMFWLNSTNGRASMVGQMRTGFDNDPAIIISGAGDSWNNNDQSIVFTNTGQSIGFANPNGYTESAAIWCISDPTVNYPLNLRGYGMGVRIWNDLQLSNNKKSWSEIWSNQDFHVYTSNRLEMIAGNNMELRVGNGNGIYFESSGSNAYARNSTAGGQLRLHSDGMVVVDFSTRSLKTDIQPAPADERIFEIEGKTFLSKPDVEEFEELQQQPRPFTLAQQKREDALIHDGLRRQFGAIAEEMEDAGLTELVNHDENGDPASLRLELLALKMLPFLKELWEAHKASQV